MQETIQSFTDYLQTEKKASKNTEVSYQRDLRKLAVFLKEHGIEKPEQMNATVLNSYLLYLEREHFSPATISRSIAAIHMFCQYACQEGKMVSDPSKALQPPRVERKAGDPFHRRGRSAASASPKPTRQRVSATKQCWKCCMRPVSASVS